jgi:hypothetical protein
VRAELGFVPSSSSSYHPCLLSPQSSPSKNSNLNDRWSAKLRTTDKRRTGYLRRKLGGWLRKKRTGDERRKQNRGGRRRKNGGRHLRRRPKRGIQDRRS